jgi:hypothetical protein
MMSPILAGIDGHEMKAFELRWADGTRKTFLLPSDEAAMRYAAAITARCIHVQIWLDGTLVGLVRGTNEAPLPGASLFDPLAVPDEQADAAG